MVPGNQGSHLSSLCFKRRRMEIPDSRLLIRVWSLSRWGNYRENPEPTADALFRGTSHQWEWEGEALGQLVFRSPQHWGWGEEHPSSGNFESAGLGWDWLRDWVGLSLQVTSPQCFKVIWEAGEKWRVGSRSLNVIPVRPQAWKEGRDGRGERPETSHVTAARQVTGWWDSSESENSMDHCLEAERNVRVKRWALVIVLLSFLSLDFSITRTYSDISLTHRLWSETSSMQNSAKTEK